MTQGGPGGSAFSLPARKRLQQTSEFERVRREGERLARGCLILNWQKIEGRPYSRLGVVTSRKVGNAPARARARRLLRESFRLHQNELRRPVDLVLVARPSIQGKAFAQVEKDYLAALRQARLLGEEN